LAAWLTLGSTSAVSGTRRRCATPNSDKISSSAAPANAAIAPMNAIWPIFQNPYAFSSIPRSVVPLNTVATWSASAAFFGSAIALAESWL